MAQLIIARTGDYSARPRHISPARIAVATVLSFGFYSIYWHYLTWKQMGRDSDGHRPAWHAIGFVIPFASLVINHRHASLIRLRSAEAGNAPSIRPRVITGMVFAAGASLLAQILFLNLNTLDSELTELLIALSMDAFDTLMLMGIVLWSQRDLNAVWKTGPGELSRETRLGIGELAVLGIGGFFWFRSISCLITLIGE